MVHHEDCIISPDEGRLWGEEGGGEVPLIFQKFILRSYTFAKRNVTLDINLHNGPPKFLLKTYNTFIWMINASLFSSN